MNSNLDLKLILESILETAVDGIINIDSKGIIININQAALNIFQFTKEETVGNNVNMLMNKEERQNHDTYINSYLTTRKPKIIGIGREVTGKKKNGDIFHFRLAVSEVLLNDKIIFTGIIHDLTDVKNAYQELEDLNKKLDEKVTERTYEVEKVVNKLLSTNKLLQEEIKERQEAEALLIKKEEELNNALVAEKELNELKSRFITTASHEFRTPLATILSSASIIHKYPLADQQTDREKHVGKIKNAVNHLTGLLNDFLSLSKLEEGKVNINKEEFNVCSEIKKVIEALSGIFKLNQNIHVNCQQNLDIFTDKNILKNILFNIISNAIKYSDKDIEIEVINDKNTISISIKDSGIGIPLDEQKYLFTRFFRANNVGNTQGTGLGLNIVKRYCDLLEADINFTSELEQGTTVKITIPKNKYNK